MKIQRCKIVDMPDVKVTSPHERPLKEVVPLEMIPPSQDTCREYVGMEGWAFTTLDGRYSRLWIVMDNGDILREHNCYWTPIPWEET